MRSSNCPSRAAQARPDRPIDIIPKIPEIRRPAPIRQNLFVRDALLNDEFATWFEDLKNALKNRQWKKALRSYEALNEFLAARTGEHFVVETEPGRYVGASDAVMLRMRALPPEALETFRDLTGRAAKRLFDRAVATGSRTLLSEVDRAYFMSDCGPLACRMMADAAFALGNWEEAAPLLARLAFHCPAYPDNERAAVLAMLAETGRMLGREGMRKDTLKRLAASDAGLLLAGRSVNAPQAAEILGTRPAVAVRTFAGAVQPLSGPSRTDVAREGFLPGARIAGVEVPGSTFTAEVVRSCADRGLEAPFIMYPAVSGNVAYAASASGVAAFDLKTSEVLWEFSTSCRLHPPGVLNAVCAPAPGRGLVFATLYSDGTGDEPAGWDVYAFDCDTGAVRWRASMADEAPDTLAKAVSISSPVFSDGTLFVSTAGAGRDVSARLLALDPATGRVLWNTFLASGMSPDPYRLLSSGVVPSVGEGLVFAVTNLGAVAAVHAKTGEIAWLVKYTPFTMRMKRYHIPRMMRWNFSTCVSAAGRLFVVAEDSAHLLALDAKTGKLLWRFPRVSIGRGRGVIWAGKDRLVVVGGELIMLDAKTGRVIWTKQLPYKPAGRGVAAGDSLYLPAKDGMHVTSLADGRETSGIRWAEEDSGGNVVFSRGRCIVGTRTGISIYESCDASLARPGTYEDTLAARADLLARKGEPEDACRLLRLALSSEPTAAYRKRLVLALLQLARKSESGKVFAKAAAALKEVAAITTDRRTRTDARFALASLFEKMGDFAGALRVCGEIIKAQDRVHYPPGVPDGTAAELMAEHRTARLIRAHGSAIYAALEREAGTLARQAPEGDADPRFENVQRSIIRSYPNSALAGEAYFKLSAYHEAKKESAISIMLLEEFLDRYPASKRRADAFRELVRLYENLGDLRRSMRTLDRAGRAGDAGLSAWAEKLKSRENLSRVSPSILGEPLTEAWRTPIYFLDRHPECLVPDGERPAGYFFVATEKYIECRMADTGAFYWRCSLAELCGREGVLWDRRAACGMGCVAFSARDKIAVIDVEKGVVRWTYEIKPPKRGEGDAPGIGAGNFNRVSFAGGYVLVAGRFGVAVAIDAATGKLYWEHDFSAHITGRPVLQGGDVIIATEIPAKVTGIKLATGKVSFELKIPGGIGRISKPLIPAGDGDFFVMLGPGAVARLDMKKKSVAWTSKRTDFIRDAVVAGGSVVLALGGGANYRVVALDATTGAETWEKKYGDSEIVKLLSERPDAKDVFAVVSDKSRNLSIQALNAATGKDGWTWRKPGLSYKRNIKAVGFGGECIMVPHYRMFFSELSLVNADTGTARTLTFPGRELESCAVYGDRLVAATSRNVFGFSSTDHIRIKRELLRRGDAVRADPRDYGALLKTAALHYQLGNLEFAKGVLLGALLSEDILTQHCWYNRLQQFLEAVVERQSEQNIRLDVPRLAHAPLIDGELSDDYARQHTIELKKLSHVSRIQREREIPLVWAGRDDLSARVSLGWDKKNFYICVDVDDNVMRAFDRDSDNWVGDILLVAVDARNDGGQSFRIDDELLSLGLVLPRKRKLSKEEEEREEALKPEGDYFVKRKDDNSGLVYELAIPWTWFQKHGTAVDPAKGPEEGLTFGVDIIVVDDDLGNGATKASGWTPGVKLHTLRRELWRGYVPDNFAKVRLTGGPGKKKEMKSEPVPVP